METLTTPQGTLSALSERRLASVARCFPPAMADQECPPIPPSPHQLVARHIGRELLAIRHDRARLTEALLHLAEL